MMPPSDDPTSVIPRATTGVVLHLIVMSQATGDESVLLMEREQGIVEFPRIEMDPFQVENEAAVLARIASEIGLEVAIGGFIGADAGAPEGENRFLLVRSAGGAPRFIAPHVGWEWRPAARLLTRQSIPKLMADELRSFMNC
jgi:hypothetical protein